MLFADERVIKDPVLDYLDDESEAASFDFRAAAKWDEIGRYLRYDIDLDGDGREEVFLSLPGVVNGRMGNVWSVYTPVSGGYRYVDNCHFHSMGPMLVDLKNGQRALLAYWRHSAVSGLAIIITMKGGQLNEVYAGEITVDSDKGVLHWDHLYTKAHPNPEIRTPPIPAEVMEEKLPCLDADVCVYGGTASGMMAGIAAAKAGKSVVIVEPSRWLGGMVGGGLGVATDCKYPRDVGGLTKTMLEREAGLDSKGSPGKQAALRKLFATLASEFGVEIVFEHRLARTKRGVNRVNSLVLERARPNVDGCPTYAKSAIRPNGLRINAKVFIDATYEGDLMAAAGVSYAVGRESRDQYGESMAGVGNLKVFDIDPYVVPGDPTSGLLPMIDPAPLGELGAASPHVMAYNFRLQFVPEGEGTPLLPPIGYDEGRYALVRRTLETNPRLVKWPHSNYDQGALISGGMLDRQSGYADGTWTARSRIWREWIDHVRIMHHLTGATEELKKGDYADSGDFPHQLYIRMGRRMVGDYVMTQKNLTHEITVEDSVGLGYYYVAMFPARLVAVEGKVAAEGGQYTMISPGPYPIAYRALTPKATECSNLLVPVCLSASYVSMSSMRLEPTYMILGESAGIAAAQAIDEEVAVQQIDQERYRAALKAAGQVVQWDGKVYEDLHARWRAWKEKAEE